MIINFSVQNFGSIKDKQTLSFEADKSEHLEDIYVIKTETGHRLLKLGLIYGANASGKTTILNVLEFLIHIVLNPEEKKTDLLRYKPFLLDDISLKSNSLISIEFIQNKIRYFYTVEFSIKAIVKESLFHFEPKKTLIFKRESDLDNQFTNIKFGNKVKIDSSFKKTLESNTLWNNTVLGGFLKTNIKVKELQDVIEWFKQIAKAYNDPYVYDDEDFSLDLITFIDYPESKNVILNLLKKADLNISNLITFTKDDVKDLLNHPDLPKELTKVIDLRHKHLIFEYEIDGKEYMLSLEDQSSGTKRFLELSLYLFGLIRTPQTNFLVIDELESSLHPDLYIYFLMTYLVNSKNTQLLVTTHNREILNNKDIFRDDAIWITDKNNPALATELYSLADFDTSVIRDTTNRLNAYKSGKLGGVPNLGDYFIDALK